MLVLALSAMAQQDLFQWRIAAHAGVDRSLGDIESSYSDVAWERSRVYGLEVSKALSYGLSLGLDVNSSRLSGYDVKTGRKDRALNFMSKLHTAQLDLTFRMDNGRLLKYDARFAPFLSIGVGAGRYDTFGVLVMKDDMYCHVGAIFSVAISECSLSKVSGAVLCVVVMAFPFMFIIIDTIFIYR